MRKILIIIIIVILLALLGTGLYFLLSSKNSSSNPSGNQNNGQVGNIPTASTSSGGFVPANIPDYLGRASQVLGPLPTGTLLSLGTSKGTVQVNNFYLADPPVNQDGEVIIKQTNNYLFVYDPSGGSFWIGIAGTQFGNIRATAESDFLQTLNIGEGDACKLNVTVGAVYSPGNPNDGISLPLSFCAQGKF